jgi:hypothetical protein
MSWKAVFLLALFVVGAIGYFLWGKIEQAPPEATLPGYTNALKNDELKAQAAVAGAQLEGVKSAVEKYRSDKGSLPPTLQDLVPNYIDHIPGGITYDPSSGNVSVAQ